MPTEQTAPTEPPTVYAKLFDLSDFELLSLRPRGRRRTSASTSAVAQLDCGNLHNRVVVVADILLVLAALKFRLKGTAQLVDDAHYRTHTHTLRAEIRREAWVT